MPTPISPDALDIILAIQLTVAWAAERQGEPSGLGWWETSLADPDGGGDFFQRMFPRTHIWAALGSIREAARRVDEKARNQTAHADKLITLFHFGFDWDEALQERLEFHKRQAVEPVGVDDIDVARRDPASVFGKYYAIGSSFDKTAFEKYLHDLSGNVAYEIVPGGRQLKSAFGVPAEAAVQLARALLPLVPNYPLPFYRLTEGR
jgi:hypothetical protein